GSPGSRERADPADRRSRRYRAGTSRDCSIRLALPTLSRVPTCDGVRSFHKETQRHREGDDRLLFSVSLCRSPPLIVPASTSRRSLAIIAARLLLGTLAQPRRAPCRPARCASPYNQP